MNHNQKVTVIASAAAAAIAAGVIGVAITGGGATVKPSTPTGSVLTGKPGSAGPVLAVKIDNAPGARPQSGLNGAAIVYAIQVEGGLSRYMAIYDTNTALPTQIGPVRSARQTDIQLLKQYGHPALAFSGAQSGLLRHLKGSDDLATYPGGQGFYRSSARPAPHNEYLNPGALPGLRDKAGKAPDIGLKFGKPPVGGVQQDTHTAWLFTFRWNGEQYRVNGSASLTDNVIVQHVKVEASDYKSRTGFVPYTQTVGHGTGELLRNGKTYAITWDRPSEDSGTTYKHNGKPVNLTPGRTWIVLR